jgi:hypothetical protein
MVYRPDPPISVEETRKLAGVLADRKDTVASSGEFDGLAWEPQQLLDLALPLHPISKSPYMEVASYCGRWLLRDGYHRSFQLLNQGVHLIPCVVVYAESLAQMGAMGTRFFSQEVLFSEQPPMVTDFLDDQTTVLYSRTLPKQVVPFTNQQSQQTVATVRCQQEAL